MPEPTAFDKAVAVKVRLEHLARVSAVSVQMSRNIYRDAKTGAVFSVDKLQKRVDRLSEWLGLDAPAEDSTETPSTAASSGRK